MPVFNDSEAVVYELVPEGDYVVRVIEFDIGLSKGSKTAGCDQYEVKVEVEGHKCRLYEVLIDHPSCAWKIDLFLKCMGVKIEKGKAFEFDYAKAQRAGITYVDPYGLRGHVRIVVEEPREPGRKRRNKVAVWYTDRPKLDPVRPPSAEKPVEAEVDDIPF